ncbi:SIR2 family protein [Aeromonas veronii]|uniref:SIR2 family protein n=1 Tax=Aeromonas veronii TaxID=654 RepID=UPI001D0687B4|nr:SIR2 family protein [Aeromonas veronii]
MRNTILFGNGVNRVSNSAVSWDDLLNSIKGINIFNNGNLPNTMVYERIFMEQHVAEENQKADELRIKDSIAEAMQSQGSNEVFELLASLDVENYLTTNYDYAFEKTLCISPETLSTEDIYSLRRKRKYLTRIGAKYLWNIHGEIDHPKSIMLGLDHYCGSVAKIDSYVKGTYKHNVEGKSISVVAMQEKLKSHSYCFTSWVDLFFSSNVHIIGFSLDYSETDIWWLLNKRARFAADGLISNEVYFYTNQIDNEKMGLLKSFKVNVVIIDVINGDYISMYKSFINIISSKK